MANTIRLTESELRKLITESIKNILTEGHNNNPSYTHYAIHKGQNKIVNGWDYSGIDGEELRAYKKDYFIDDLVDMGMDPKLITILTRKSCEKKGINPDDDNCWSNYPMTESTINEIGETPAGQKALGALTARKKLAHKDHMKPYRYAEKARGGDNWDKFAYPNATIDAVNPMYKDYAQGYTDYLNAHPDEMMDYERNKYMNESVKKHPSVTVEVDLCDIQFPEPLNDFIDENYGNMPDTVKIEIEYEYVPYTPATYWQPAEGDEFEFYGIDVLSEPFAGIIPQEYFQQFIETVGDYADNNIDDLFSTANIDSDDGPDPDEAYENWRDSQYED